MTSHVPPFSEMIRNYDLAMLNQAPDHKSSIWQYIYECDFKDLLVQPEIWPTFLRNGLSSGFNDNILASGDKDRFLYRKSGEIKALLPETVIDNKITASVQELFKAVAQICGWDFVLKNVASNVGSPSCVDFSVNFENQNKNSVQVRTDAHDLSLIYYAWHIISVFEQMLPDDSIILEIGGGYGGMVAKIKNKNPNYKFILLDLPETCAIQHYYLANCFPDAKIVGLKEFQTSGDEILRKKDFDFLILPGSYIANFPDKYIDGIMNVRSMMEMSKKIITFYYGNIHRVITDHGVFCNYNRYTKVVGNEQINIKEHPYDELWKILLSQTAIFQKHIHMLITARTINPQRFPVKMAVKSLPPY